jgi:hypothetical protein
MKTLTYSILSVAIAVAGSVQAQDAPSIPDEIMSSLEYFVGSWEATGEMGGQSATGTFSCRWGRGKDGEKCCLVGQYSYTSGGHTRTGTNLIGWNAATNQIEDRGFSTDGGCGQLLWTIKSPEEWHAELISVSNGTTVKGEADIVIKGPTELVMETARENGETSRMVFTKVKRDRKKRAKKQ